MKAQSRPQRWGKAIATCREGLDSLKALIEEYGEWRDGLPENLEQSELAGKLDAVADLDLDSIESILDEAENMDLPRGFGRD